MRKLAYFGITFGCDPEFFFRRGDDVVGAAKILPKEGLFVGESKIIIDGVQAELNPEPATCRQTLGRMILPECFRALKEHMEQYKRLRIDFSQTIKLSDKDFDGLPDDSKKFGCMPSKNAARKGKMGKITVNPETYRYRSAGGHIHIGDAGNSVIRELLKADPVRIVKMLDILVGNTCVLIDRDPGNIERRKVYGQAGEFRTPPHGLEYRTLSNFWLRSYQLMGLVMGLTRHAIIICANDLDEEFLKLVDMDDIYKAINTNNFALALRNFKKIEDLLLQITPTVDTELYPISSDTIEQFRYFVKKGLDHWFTEDPVEHWTSPNIEWADGFENFLNFIVGGEMRDEEKKITR